MSELLGRGVTRPFFVFVCTLIQREKGDEAQRIEMFAVSPSLVSLYANFLCKNLELQECERRDNTEVFGAYSVQNAMKNAP